jgi:hypothetical protein
MADEKKALILTTNRSVSERMGSIFTDLGYHLQSQSFFEINTGSEIVKKVRSERITAIYIHQLCFAKNGQSYLPAEIMEKLNDSRYFKGIVLLGHGTDLQHPRNLSEAEEREISRSPLYGHCQLPTNPEKIKAQLQGLELHLR